MCGHDDSEYMVVLMVCVCSRGDSEYVFVVMASVVMVMIIVWYGGGERLVVVTVRL